MADITKIQPIGSSTQYELGARYLTTARTLTIGDTGKTFDGTENVSWSKTEILGSSDSRHFLRGDGTWSDTLETSSGSTLIQLVNNYNNRTDRNLWLVASSSMGLMHTPAKDATSGYKWIIRLNADQTAIMADYPYQGTFMNQTLTSSTLNSLSGSWFGSGSGDPWSGTDWCVIQCGDNVDKWQLHSLDGAHLEFRQNDNGGTNTSWGAWHSYVDRAGDTMTGDLFVKRTTATDTIINVQNSKGSISLDVAVSGNRGIWDHTGSKWLIYVDASSTKIQSGYPIYGAVWNDYAEMRNVPEANETENHNIKLAGRCVREVGDDTMVLSTERMQLGCKIISDTFGFNIGETDDCKTPIAVSGRALAYIYEGREAARHYIGQPVCSGPDGTVSIMTDEEYAAKGYCCVGTISAVPEYKTWGSGNIQVDGRIWIYVK